MNSATSLFLASTTGFLLLSACGGGGGSAGPLSVPSSVGFTVGDAPIDTLSTTTLTLSSVKLVDQNGGVTGNLLAVPRSFEFLGLATKQALLALSPSIPAGTYNQVEMTVTDAAAKDLAGAAVGVTLRTVTSRANMTDFGGTPLVFDGSGYMPCSIDIDLTRSFMDDPALPGNLLFDLVFTATANMAPAFDEFRASVVSLTPASGSFLVRIIDDTSPGQTFGLLEVRVANGDYMVHDNGRTMATAMGFLDELDPGNTVQISGAMSPLGFFDASRVIAEDVSGMGGSTARIEIEGEVQAIDTVAGTFDLFVKEIEKGASTVNPVLSSMGNPATITVSFDAATRVIANQSSNSGVGMVGSTLIPGMEVDVRFAVFSAPGPFSATSVEVGNGELESESEGVQYEGSITATSGLPLSFEITMDSTEPAVQDGLVSAPVMVSLASGPSFMLNSGPQPTLLAADLVDGLRCEIHGDLSGSPSSATLVATRVKLEPGELKGTLTAVDLVASTVTVSVSSVDRSFGGILPPAGSVVLSVDSSAFLRGDQAAMSLVDLAAMLSALGFGQTLDVELEGLADGVGGFVAWDVRAETSNNL